MIGIIISSIVFAVVVISITIVLSVNHSNGERNNKNNNYVPLSINTSEYAGEWGETLAVYHLKPLLKNDEYLLANLLIPFGENRKTEIDCVLITRRGIFCVEIKRWSGHIYGDDVDEDWIQKYDNNRRVNKRHKNPVKQNENHCDVLARFLDYKYNIDNVVLFINLEDSSGIKSDYVFTPRQFKHYYEELDDELGKNDIEDIKHRLSECVATSEELKQHKDDIKRRYGEHI